MRRRYAIVALVLTSCAAHPAASESTPVPPTSDTTSDTTAGPTTPTAAEQSTTTLDVPASDIPATSTTSTTSTTTSTTSTTTSTTSTTTSTTSTTLPTTTCTDVAHVGDSTGVYLWDAHYVDGEANTMGERYLSVGVERWVADNNGGRSTSERVADWQTNAVEAADAIRRSGFQGCWVVMIGTNDAANVAAGAGLGIEERILRMLYVIGDEPVLWVDAATNRTETAYRNDSMLAWNEVLYRIADDRPNVRVLRWSELVQREWFVADDIHMGTEGRIWRAAVTASALVENFPAR